MSEKVKIKKSRFLMIAVRYWMGMVCGECHAEFHEVFRKYKQAQVESFF